LSLIKHNVARGDDLAGGQIKASVTLLRRRVAEKDTLWSEETVCGESWHLGLDSTSNQKLEGWSSLASCGKVDDREYRYVWTRRAAG
jgi:hypothetical protein